MISPFGRSRERFKAETIDSLSVLDCAREISIKMTDEMDNDDIKNDSDIEMVADEEGQTPDMAKRIVRLKDRLDTCDEERKGYLDGWQRAKADMINYKKDESKRLEDMARFITGGMLQDLLPVLDSFDLALQSFRIPASGSGQDHEKGVLLIRSQMMDVLKKRGVVQIDVRLGEEFDPGKHESIGEITSEYPAGTIAEEVQKGYVLGERVIRPARVRLAK